MRIAIGLVVAVFSSGCATKALLPESERKTSFSVHTNLKAAEAHKRMRIWAAKNFGDSKVAIQIDDKEDGRLIARAKMDCVTQLNGMAVNDNWEIDFFMDIKSTNKMTTVALEKIMATNTKRAVASESRSNPFTGLLIGDPRSPRSSEELKRIENDCLLRLKDSLNSALASK